MSYGWSFDSFDADKLVSLFADVDGPALARLVDLIGSDFADFDDPNETSSTARAFIAAGLSYDDLDIQQSRDADEIVALIFSPEGLADDLAVAHLSDEVLHPSDIKELLARDPNSTVLPALVTGRRAGQDQPTRCDYCVLSPAEVGTAIGEIRSAMASPLPWSNDWSQASIEAYLLRPLESAGGRWVYGQLG